MNASSKLVVHALLMCGAHALSGCGDAVENFEPVAAVQAEIGRDCYFGYLADGGWQTGNGWWLTKPIAGNCSNHPSTEFRFGGHGHTPLLFGGCVASYDRNWANGPATRGRFLIDQNCNGTFDTGDTARFFMPSPEPIDQPFVMNIVKRSGPSCAAVSPFAFPVVGVMRRNEWFIDRNGNGVYDGTGGGKCDLRVTFGNDGDKPVPMNDKIAVARVSGGVLRWFVDEDRNFAWNRNPDREYVNFGFATDLPSSDNFSWQHAVRRGRQVFINDDADRNWSAGDIASAENYIPNHGVPYRATTPYNFVGWVGLSNSEPH